MGGKWETSHKIEGTIRGRLVGHVCETHSQQINSYNAQRTCTIEPSSTLVRDPRKLLPLECTPGDRPILLLTPIPGNINLAVDDSIEGGTLITPNNLIHNTADPAYNAFAKAIAKRCSLTHHIVYHPDSESKQILPLAKEAAAVIFVTRSADRSLWQQKALATISEITQSAQVPLILVSSYTPYDLLGTGSQYLMTTYICTFEFTPPALEAATAVMFGEETARGQLPVRLAFV
jgi:beta-N-acetylhexosaminidase